jgi:quercetin dioxygenase-like cupin family protein
MSENLPQIIKALPKVKTPTDSIKGHLLQGISNQAVIFEAKAGTQIPVHTHAAEWGIVVEGEFEITIGNEKTIYRKGDTFYISENTPHSGYFITDVISFHFLNDDSYFKSLNI